MEKPHSTALMQRDGESSQWSQLGEQKLKMSHGRMSKTILQVSSLPDNGSKINNDAQNPPWRLIIRRFVSLLLSSQRLRRRKKPFRCYWQRIPSTTYNTGHSDEMSARTQWSCSPTDGMSRALKDTAAAPLLPVLDARHSFLSVPHWLETSQAGESVITWKKKKTPSQRF